MSKYFLKKYIPVYSEGSIICIGYANKKDNYIEIEYNNENFNLLEKAVKAGINEAELENPLYGRFFYMNFLEKLEHYINISDINRDKLYFQYLDNNNLSETVLSTDILIFGAGALGSTIAYMFAQSGFNNLTIIDDDIVSQTDILKSMVLKKRDVGLSKVEAVYNHIKENFNIEIKYLKKSFIEYDRLKEIIDRYNPKLIVKGCDPDLIFRTNLNKICFEYDIPFIAVAYAFEKLRLGPFYIPGFTDCDESMNLQQKLAFGEHYEFKNNKKLFVGFLVHPAISYNINILASILLKEIMMYLTGQYEYCFTIGRYVVFNPLSLDFDYWEMKCNDDCKICKPLRTIQYEDNELSN